MSCIYGISTFRDRAVYVWPHLEGDLLREVELHGPAVRQQLVEQLVLEALPHVWMR
jgi:hypothetical protein